MNPPVIARSARRLLSSIEIRGNRRSGREFVRPVTSCWSRQSSPLVIDVTGMEQIDTNSACSLLLTTVQVMANRILNDRNCREVLDVLPSRPDRALRFIAA